MCVCARASVCMRAGGVGEVMERRWVQVCRIASDRRWSCGVVRLWSAAFLVAVCCGWLPRRLSMYASWWLREGSGDVWCR